MKILITGATGTIGSNAVKYFTEKGYTVLAQVRPNSQQLHKIERFKPDLVFVDLRDREALSNIVKGVDCILHLGAQVKKNSPSSYDYFDINAGSTLSLLEGVRKNNVNLKRFVFASSCVTYKFKGWNDTLITESNKYPKHVGMYRASKISAEMIVNTYNSQYNIPTVILELPDTFCGREILGERSKRISPYIEDKIDVLMKMPESKERNDAIYELNQHLKDGKKLVIPMGIGNISWKQHLGDVRDVVKACELAITVPSAVGQSMIIMSDGLDYGIGVPHLSSISGLSYAKVFIPGGDNYWFDTSKTYELLKYKSEFHSAKILEDAWRHSKGEDIGIIDGKEYSHIIR